MKTREKTILIVDDEEDIRELVEITLEDSRYHLRTAVDGNEAIKVIEEQHPDLVILDWMMPRLTGLEVVKWLRKNPSTEDIPVVMLTSRKEGDRQDEFQRLHIVSYLQKPFSPLELIQTVRETLAE